MKDVAALSTVELIEIRAACERLSLDYAYFADSGSTDALAALFAVDGEMHLFGQVHVGPEGIGRALGAGGERMTAHLTSNIRIDVLAPDRASGSAYVAAYVVERGKPAAAPLSPAVVGVYRDEYVRTELGWRFARRAFEPMMMPAT